MVSWHYSQRLIGEILRGARTLVGLSIRDLSKRSGVSTSQILRVESGEFDIMLSTLLKIAREVGVPAGLILEQGSIPNPGYYAKLIGQSGLGQLTAGMRPADFPRNAHSRLVVFSGRTAGAVASLLQSSNASKLVQLINFPTGSMISTFTDFAATIDQINVEDRVSLHRELDTQPIELLLRLKLLTREIAADFLTKHEGHVNLHPDFFKNL